MPSQLRESPKSLGGSFSHREWVHVVDHFRVEETDGKPTNQDYSKVDQLNSIMINEQAELTWDNEPHSRGNRASH